MFCAFRSSFRNVYLVTPAPAARVTMLIRSTRWEGLIEERSNLTSAFQTKDTWDIQSSKLNIRMENFTVYHARLKTNAQESNIVIDRSLFTNYQDVRPTLGGVYLSTYCNAGPSRFHITDSTFSFQDHPNPISSVMNLYEGTLMIRTVESRENPPAPCNASVLIENSRFKNNVRGLTFIGEFSQTHVHQCEFKENIAMHAGAGILLLTTPSTPTLVTESVFDSNAAGDFLPEKVRDYEENFKVSGDEVRINAPCCKGVITFVGKGGAIRVQKGNLTIRNSLFANNTARLLGGAIFVDTNYSLYITDATFQNTAIHKHSMQGDMIYSNGKVNIQSATLNVITAQNHVAVVRHSGDHWSIEVKGVSVQCPVGYRLRVTNTSAYGVAEQGLKRSYKLDQLSYFCESCPQNKYSLDYGFMNYSLTYFSDFAYYTILINGSKPRKPYKGSFYYHDIECMDCPYGGKCHEGISSVANFWGYLDKGHIKFQHCPKGYCCTSKDCDDYNTCAENRMGTLCGACNDGYSEALFSPQCVPDDNCNPTFLYPVALLSGMLYALFLLFQKDMRDMMFMNTISCKDLPLKRRKYEANHVNTQDESSRSPLQGFGELDNIVTDSEMEPDGMTSLTEEDIETKNNNRKPEEEEEEVDESIPAEAAAQEAPPDTGASFLIILFYYFQDAQLLHIKTVFAVSESKSRGMIKQILSGLFKFRVELFQFMDTVCFISGITPVDKLLYKALLVPYVIIQFGVMYMVYRWCFQVCAWVKQIIY